MSRVRDQFSNFNQESALTQEDQILDITLRPKRWEEYIGQEKIKRSIQVMIQAAKQRGQTPEHILFHGSAGLGKTSLSYLIAKEMGKNIRVTSGPAIERAGDLAAILTNLEPGDVLFIDEAHRLNAVVEEYLYPAMEEFKLHLILGKGPLARTLDLELPPFTLIAATTRLALLSAPLRSRFGAIFQLDFYTIQEIAAILERSAQILKVETDKEALLLIAQRSRFTPRVANRLLKRIRDFAQVEGEGKITLEQAKKALEFLEIDEQGLEPTDRLILRTLIEKFGGGPVGLKSLAAACAQEEDTILEVYEPYLMRLGFIERTPKGRVATPLAYEHLKIKPPWRQKKLLGQPKIL